MKKGRIAFFTNAIISGFFAYFIAEFLAAGTIAENYTGEKYVAPEFFIILVFWAAAFLFGLITSFKFNFKLNRILTIVFLWLSIPVGISIGMELAIRANESDEAQFIQQVLVAL